MTSTQNVWSPRVHAMTVSRVASFCGAGVVFLGISRLHQHLTFLAKAQVPSLLALGALVLLFTAPEGWRPGDLFKHWSTKIVLVIAAIVVVGVPLAIYPGRSLGYLQESYSRTILIWITAWALSRTVEGARYLARTLTLAGLTACALAVMLGKKDSAGRLAGAYTYDPNDIALVSVLTLPMVLWWVTDKRSGWTRWLMPLSIPMLLYIVLESDSRAGFLGLCAVVFGLMLHLGRLAPLRVRKVAKIAAFAPLVAIPFIPSDYLDRVGTINDQADYNYTSSTGRVAIWKRGFGYMITHPVTGVGIHNFNTAEGWLAAEAQERADEGRGWKRSTAHNSFVQVGAELGVVAAVLFPLLLIKMAIGLRRWNAVRPPGEPEDLLPAFTSVVFIAYIVNAAFLSFAYYDITYAYLALAAGQLHPLRQAAGRLVRGGSRVPAPLAALASVPGQGPADNRGLIGARLTHLARRSAVR